MHIFNYSEFSFSHSMFDDRRSIHVAVVIFTVLDAAQTLKSKVAHNEKQTRSIRILPRTTRFTSYHHHIRWFCESLSLTFCDDVFTAHKSIFVQVSRENSIHAIISRYTKIFSFPIDIASVAFVAWSSESHRVSFEQRPVKINSIYQMFTWSLLLR